MVYLPLRNQWEGLHPIYYGKMKFMFQTTKQITSFWSPPILQISSHPGLQIHDIQKAAASAFGGFFFGAMRDAVPVSKSRTARREMKNSKPKRCLKNNKTRSQGPNKQQLLNTFKNSDRLDWTWKKLLKCKCPQEVSPRAEQRSQGLRRFLLAVGKIDQM